MTYLAQVSEVAGLVQVKSVGSVVGEDPREDRVLVQIVERASGHSVQEHQVIEVGDLTLKRTKQL